jgi:hypothetical protein
MSTEINIKKPCKKLVHTAREKNVKLSFPPFILLLLLGVKSAIPSSFSDEVCNNRSVLHCNMSFKVQQLGWLFLQEYLNLPPNR